jgi:hypothetical protein
MEADIATPLNGHPLRLLDQMRGRIRVKHYSIQTEQVYVDWVRWFIV